jgi:hypothetical protein
MLLESSVSGFLAQLNHAVELGLRVSAAHGCPFLRTHPRFDDEEGAEVYAADLVETGAKAFY